MFRGIAVYDGDVGQSHAVGADLKRAALAVGVDRDPIVAVNRDPAIGGDLNRAVGQRNHPFQAVGKRDRHRFIERFGIGNRLA